MAKNARGTPNHCVASPNTDTSTSTSTSADIDTNTDTDTNATGVCECSPLFTGSHCKSQYGFEAVTFSYDDSDILFGDLPVVANSLGLGVFVSVAVVSFSIIVAYVYTHPK